MSTVRIDRPNNQPIGTDSYPFWPAGRTWVDVTIASDGTVTSVDHQGHGSFTAKLLSGQEQAFLEAVRVGNAGKEVEPPSNDNQATNAGAEANTVIVSDPGPGGGSGPKKFYEVGLPVAFLTAKRPTGT
jgi:hypothetical protein